MQDGASCDELVQHPDAAWMVRVIAPLDDPRIKFAGYSIFNQVAQQGSGSAHSAGTGSQ